MNTQTETAIMIANLLRNLQFVFKTIQKIVYVTSLSFEFKYIRVFVKGWESVDLSTRMIYETIICASSK
jgi:hypothetical protein